MILGSKKQFVPLYLKGTKKHSLRKGNRWKEGMSIQFFQDTRTKKMKKFMEDKICTGVQDVTLIEPFYPSDDDEIRFHIEVDGVRLNKKEMLQLAKNDGFKSTLEFMEFFFPPNKKRSVMDWQWEGQIVHWTDLRY